MLKASRFWVFQDKNILSKNIALSQISDCFPVRLLYLSCSQGVPSLADTFVFGCSHYLPNSAIRCDKEDTRCDVCFSQ